MKRDELRAGEAYLRSTHKDWANGHGWRDERVTVLDTGRWSRSGYRWRTKDPDKRMTLENGETIDIPSGIENRFRHYERNGVLCRTDEGKLTVVPLNQIRGDYDECTALIEKNKKQRREAYERQNQLARDNADRGEAIEAALKEFGIDCDYNQYGRWGNDPHVRLRLDAAERLVSILKKEKV
jgi:hypothetical protein